MKAQPSFHDDLHDVEVNAKRKRYLWGLQPPLCYRRQNLFVYVSRIARSSRRNWVGLYDVSIRYTVAIVVLSTCNIFPQLSRVGCSFQGKLFSISKLLCLVFATYYLSFCTALENCVLFVISLRPSWENFFSNKRFRLLTKAINLSRLGSCSMWILGFQLMS